MNCPLLASSKEQGECVVSTRSAKGFVLLDNCRTMLRMLKLIIRRLKLIVMQGSENYGCVHLECTKQRMPHHKYYVNNSLVYYRVREFMAFTSDVLVERTRAGQRQSVKEQGTPISNNILARPLRPQPLVVQPLHVHYHSLTSLVFVFSRYNCTIYCSYTIFPCVFPDRVFVSRLCEVGLPRLCCHC